MSYRFFLSGEKGQKDEGHRVIQPTFRFHFFLHFQLGEFDVEDLNFDDSNLEDFDM